MLDKSHRHATEITSVEMRALRLLAQGLSNKAIAREVGGSDRTIEVHIRNLRKKLGASSRTHVATLAVGLGIVRIVEPLRETK